MNKPDKVIRILFAALSHTQCAQQEINRPIIRPAEVIIRPPTTVAEFMAHRAMLKEKLLIEGVKNIVLKDK